MVGMDCVGCTKRTSVIVTQGDRLIDRFATEVARSSRRSACGERGDCSCSSGNWRKAWARKSKQPARPGDNQRAASDLAQVDQLKEDSLALAETDSAILPRCAPRSGGSKKGTYGRCVVDGEPIGEKRLEAVPWTPSCLKHQSELEERVGIHTPSL